MLFYKAPKLNLPTFINPVSMAATTATTPSQNSVQPNTEKSTNLHTFAMDIWCTFLEQFEGTRISSDQCVILEHFRTKLVDVEVSPSAEHLLIVIRQWYTLSKKFEGQLTPVQFACFERFDIVMAARKKVLSGELRSMNSKSST